VQEHVTSAERASVGSTLSLVLLALCLGCETTPAQPDLPGELTRGASATNVVAEPHVSALPAQTLSAGVPAAKASTASASAARLALPSVPRFLPDNPACQVPEGYEGWSWKRVHRVEGLAERAVIFTLDVGAKLPNLEGVLDVLRVADVKATIFLYAAELRVSERGKAAVRRMVADGHELANHTLSHKDLTKMTAEEVEEELDAVERFTRETTGKSAMPFFREPFLATNDEVDAIIKQKCLRPIWFTIDTADWQPEATAAGIEKNVFEHKGKPRSIEPGSIFIFHGSQKENIAALPSIVARLRADGFSFLTLGEGLRRSGRK